MASSTIASATSLNRSAPLVSTTALDRHENCHHFLSNRGIQLWSRRGPRTLANERLLVLGLLGVGHPAPLGAELLADLAEGELGVRGDDLGALRLAELHVRAGLALGLVSLGDLRLLGGLGGLLGDLLGRLGRRLLGGGV